MAKTKTTQMVPKEPSTESSNTDNDYGSGASASYKAGIESDRMRRKSENAEAVKKTEEVSERAASNQQERNRSDALFVVGVNDAERQQARADAIGARNDAIESANVDRRQKAADSNADRELASSNATKQLQAAMESNATAKTNAAVAANSADNQSRVQAESSKLASMFAGTTRSNYWGSRYE